MPNSCSLRWPHSLNCPNPTLSLSFPPHAAATPATSLPYDHALPRHQRPACPAPLCIDHFHSRARCAAGGKAGAIWPTRRRCQKIWIPMMLTTWLRSGKRGRGRTPAQGRLGALDLVGRALRVLSGPPVVGASRSDGDVGNGEREHRLATKRCVCHDDTSRQ
jgi:hypothetical protein